MIHTGRLTRRRFIRLGSGWAALSAAPLALAQEAKEVTLPKNRRLFLLVDWFHIKKGELRAVLDPARISAEGRKQIEKLAREFGPRFEEGPHGLRPVDVPFGVRITQEAARKTRPWLPPDQPWEQSISWCTVLKEGARYRCWYQTRLNPAPQDLAMSDGRGMELKGSALAYAESTDGLVWTKPALNVLSYNGTTQNNLVSPYANGGSVFRDDHGPPEERYKAFHFDELPRAETGAPAASSKLYGLYAVTSPDGYRWKRHSKPLIRYFSDTDNIAAWDSLLGKYVGFFRHHFSERTISRAETDDFWNWPPPQPLLYSDPQDAPADDYYTSGYTVYPDDPSLRLLFAAIYHRDTDLVDVRLAISRDGRVFQWLSREPILRHGLVGEWDAGAVYAAPNLVHLPDRSLALPFSGYNTSHNEAWFKNFYTSYKNLSGAAWATWGHCCPN